MVKKRHTAEQIIRAFHKADQWVAQGLSNEHIAGKIGVSVATLYNWRRQYAGMDLASLKELKSLREENARLKRIVADQALECDALREIAKGKL